MTTLVVDGRRVDIVDVTLRDGLQIQPTTVPTVTKVALGRALATAGLREIELGAFVHPHQVPQMADSGDVFAALAGNLPGVTTTALVPNVRGAERALAAGAHAVRVVLSCSEGHSLANTRRTVAEGLCQAHEVVRRVRQTGVGVSVGLATAFVCPFDGPIAPERLTDIVDEVTSWDVTEVSLADTLGRADPRQVAGTLGSVRTRHPTLRVGLHLHNTYGMAAANACAGLDTGVRRFDAALGGIGGCPFAPGAAGNIATEDLVFMLHAMGYQTGVDLALLAPATRLLADAVPTGLDSALPRALGWLTTTSTT